MNFTAILLFAAALFAVAADAQENWFKDGLKGWTLSNRKTIVLDPTEKLTNFGSLRLMGDATARRVVKLEPNSVYKLSFSVKGKEISNAEDDGARISCNCKNIRKWFRITSMPNNAPETGTFDWRKGSGLIDTNAAGGTEIVLGFMLKGTGTVWYDDIKLEKLKIYKLPPEWSRVNPKSVFADSEVKVSAEYSIRLENANNSQIQIQKEIELEPGVQYELTFYLKGKELSDGSKRGACLLVCGADRKQWTIVPVDGKNTWQTGSFDWKQGKLKFFTKMFGCNKILILPTVNGKGTAWFDQIEVKKIEETSAFRKNHLPGGAETVFYPLGISGFFLPDEPMLFRLESAGKGEADYIVRLKDFSGKEPEVVRKGKITLPGQIQIDFPAMKQGYYVANAEVFINGQAACFRQAGAVSAPEVKRRDPFFQLSYGVYSELHDAYKRAGVGTIALKLRCSDHLVPGRRKVEDVIERWLRSYETFLNSPDFQLDLSIGTTIRHSSNPKHLAEGRGTLNDAFTENILKGIRLAAERTKGKIKEWNIGSEIPSVARMPKYLGTWSEAIYSQMVITRMASRIARQIDPGIKIYFGGNNIREYTSTIERFVFSDLVKEVDGYFIDAYTGNWDMMLGNYSIPEKNLRLFYKEASDLSASFGKSPNIKNNETGYSINYGAAFGSGIAVEQAELTARTIILTKAAPVAGFELHMPTFHHGLKGKKDDSGCMTTIWKPVLYRSKIHEIPLPGGAMYATAARELAFAQIRKELIVGAQYACIFARPDGKTVAAVWNIEEPQDLKIILNKKAQLIDMVGSESVLGKGEATLKTSTSPIYLVTEESPEYIAQTLSSAISSATYGLKYAAKLHDGKTVSLYIRNPGIKTVEAELIGDGKKLKQVTLLPGKINTFRVPLCQNFKIISNGKTYQVQPDKSYLKIQRVKNRPVFDGFGKWLTGLTPGKLRYPGDIYPKSALQPELCHFKTSFNPDGHNVSADYYIAYDAENFYLAVTVEDPVHLQKDDKGNLWKGDSIQWVISSVEIPPKEVRPHLMEQKICSNLNFGLALTSKGPEFRRYLGKPGILKYPCNVTRKGNTTFYEAAIPWSELGVKPDSGKALRFSLVVFDKNSEKTKGCPYHLAVTPGVAGGTDDSEYRLMIFEKE